MREESAGAGSAELMSGKRRGKVRKLRRGGRIFLAAIPAGGGCLALGLALTGHSFGRISVHLPHVLDESIALAGVVLLAAAVLAVIVVLILVLWCFWAAIRNVGDQDTSNRWIDLATRMVYTVTGGRLSGLRKAPAQLCNEPAVHVPAAPEARIASFWELLTPAEQADLVASAAETKFQQGSVLCREGQRADRVFVIRTGRIAVCVEAPIGQQLVAIRNAGDIVGERAALQIAERSATVTALEDVTAYAVPTGDFSAFLHRYPRVLEIIENQIYRRLAENRPQYAVIDTDCPVGVVRKADPWIGQNCTIVLIDVANFSASTRIDSDRRIIRAKLYQIARGLFENPEWRHDYHCEDRGDGILLIIPPNVPTSSIVGCILGDLLSLLHRHNSGASVATRFQMRVALDVGPVVSDANGVDGLAIIQAARLVEAPVLKRHLAQTGADLGFITSPFVYDTIIKPNPGRVDPAFYRQLKCQVKKHTLSAWMYLAQESSEIRPPAA